MKKKIRGVYLAKILPAAAAMLVLAAILFAVTGFGAFKAFGEPVQMKTLAADELKGKWAYVRISDILGDFAASAKSRAADGSVVEYKERYCVLLTDSGDYVGVCIRGKSELIAAEQYVSALEAYTTEELSQFNMGSVTGTVGKLGDDLYSILCDWVEQESGAEHDEQFYKEHVLPIVLENGHLGTMPAILTWILSIIAVLLVAAALVFIIAAFTGYWEKPMRSLITSEGADAANAMFDAGEDFGPKLRVGKDRIFVSGKLVTDVVKTEDVIWTYGRSRRLDAGGTVWSLIIKTTGGEEYSAQTGDAGSVQAATDKIVSFGGPVVTGFDKDKQRLYERDLTGFIGRAKKLHAAQAAQSEK